MKEKKIYTAPSMELVERLDVVFTSPEDSGIIITPPHKW